MENNKTIMRFMGLKPNLNSPDKYSWSDLPFFSTNGSVEDVFDSMAKYVKYNSSWDWLHPCIVKAMITEHPNKDAHMKLNDAWLTMNIDEVYSEVVNFIITLQS